MIILDLVVKCFFAKIWTKKNNYAPLLVSVNVASLGIIFSSLSGVIALKEYIKVVRKEKFRKGRGVWYYIGMDTLFNVVGVIILVPLSYLSLSLQ